jgi:hypothetical protein
MNQKKYNLICEEPLPVDIVLSPSWWFKHAGITFDKDFFFHPARRVEDERKMEQVLYDKWGNYGLGKDRNIERPEVGAVHLAAGFMLSEMLGCQVDYLEDRPPQVIPLLDNNLSIDDDSVFNTPVFKSFTHLKEELSKKYGRLTGDVNWGGILNLALDLRGQDLFIDIIERPDELFQFFTKIKNVISRFVSGIESMTNTSSISVNRNVVHFNKPVFLHSECSNTMISVDHYEKLLFPLDAEWSRTQRPFGIHYCGEDPHRFAQSFARIPYLDFLDVGWGGDLKVLRHHLPHTFLNIRLSPVAILTQTVDEVRQTVIRLVEDSNNPWLTGVCCINMDDRVEDDKITAIFETVDELRKKYQNN